MRVLYFHQHFSTPQGATGNRSYAMARGLISRGHSVIMVCGSYGGADTGLTMPFYRGVRRGTVDGIDVIEFQMAYSNKDSFFRRTVAFLKFAARSIGLVFWKKYELIFATSTPLTAGIPGIVGRWVRRRPFVFEVRDLWPELPRQMGVIRNPVILKLMDWLEWITYHSAHRLVGLSPGIVAGIMRRGVASDRITLVPNGCDLDFFSAHVKPWRPAGISSADLMAVYAGTHGLANGLDAVIDVAIELKRRGRKDIRLVLIGDGSLKNQLVSRAEKKQLENVTFHPPVSKMRLAGLLQASDLGFQILANVPAFYYGTSPNKFFDYIAAGLPVLTNYPGWLADMITAGRCGFAVPPDDPAAFADALEYAAAHREEIKTMGKHGRDLAQADFDRTVLAQRFVGWLEQSCQAG